MSFRYLGYNASRTVPNVVVDGSPNEGTVLTLTHWPGIAQPVGLAADLSAQMVFGFVRSGVSAAADVVTNNHLDQDGREERSDVDLAIVDIAASEPHRRGHRFAADEYVGVHPMAINNATGCLRILQVHGRRYTYTDRYESWVQYQSRRPLPRVDLRPLAEQLSTADATVWTASSPSSLTAQLQTAEESSLDRKVIVDHLIERLRSAPPAWNPYSTPG